MRTLTVIEFLTLDGVMQGFGSPDEDREGGFAHGGWTWPYWHDDNCGEYNNHLKIGKEGYMLSADGELMPTKKDQPPPSLKYFKQPQK